MRVFLVAGEASADAHGAALLRELKQREPGVQCYGVGGAALAREGMDICVEARALNIVGVFELWDRAGEVLGAYRTIKREVGKRGADCAILLDLPDFNLMMAKRLKALGIPVVYYLSPQVWAWRKYRVRTIRRVVDKMLVVFPFEKSFYDRQGVDAEFVGHPLLDAIEPRREYRAQDEVARSPRIAVLPGSRKSELSQHGALLEALVSRLRDRYPDAEIRVPVASTLRAAEVSRALGAGADIVEGGNARETVRWADVAIVASGTATLETALIATPFCLYYRFSRVTGWFVKSVYRGFLGMPNLLHGREVAREFLREKASAPLIFDECVRLIEDEAYRVAQVRELRACRELLGNSGANARVAERVVAVAQQQKNMGRSGAAVSVHA